MNSQIEILIERELLVLVDDDLLSVTESELISFHLLTYGWPVSKEEAFSVEGLSESRALWLADSEFWSRCIRRSNEQSKSNSTRVVADVERDYENQMSHGVMLLSGRMGLRYTKGFSSGFVKSSLGNCKFIIGDHRRHWGAGLAVNRYDPFNSLRYSHELSSPSRAFDGALPLPGTEFIRGSAATINLRRGWVAASVGYIKGTDEINVGATWFRESLIKSGRLVSGVIASLDTASHCVGLTSRLEHNSLSLESELVLDEEGFSWLHRGVLAGSTNDQLYWNFESDGTCFLGLQLGERRNGSRIEAKLGGELRFITSRYFEWDDALELEVRARVRKTENGLCYDARLRGGHEIIKGAVHVQSELKNPRATTIALRVDVKRGRKISVALLRGGEDVEERLYALLPTSKGHRLYSIGDESRAQVYVEVIPGRVKMCVERVWYRRETEDIHPYNFSNRVSIRAEWQ